MLCRLSRARSSGASGLTAPICAAAQSLLEATPCLGLSVLSVPSTVESTEQRESQPSAQSVGRLYSAFVSLRAFSTSVALSSDSRQQQAARKAVDPLWNWPNAISGARLLSGPAIAYLIITGAWGPAFVSLGVSGFSDWLDGFVARRFDQGSVIGSYLDPLADKVLICSTVGALAYEGSLSAPLAALVIGRDLFLVGGAFVLRLRSFDWRWPGWNEYFRTVEPAVAPQHARRGHEVGPAPFVQPLLVSKLNTVSQLGLAASCIASSWYGWPPEGVVLGFGGATCVLTIASWHAYWRQHRLTQKQSDVRQ